MKMTVIGCGYLGAVHAASMASLGHDVVGIDIDRDKVRALAAGRSPFHEPGLEDILDEGIADGNLRFTADPSAADVRGRSLHFITVGTPQATDAGAADLSHLMSAVSMLAEALDPAERAVVVGKSTVPVGTAARVERELAAAGAYVAWNPEFLREGYAVEDTLRPSRLVYGLSDNPEAATRGREALDEAYRPLLEAGTPVIASDFATAELVKVAANSFLATKISFINAMAEICDATGADVTMLAHALGHDERIGRRALGAGIGFGGGCLPKDIRAFVARAEELGRGESVAFLKEVDAINLRGRSRAVAAAEAALGGSVRGANIAVLGASFKPDTDDVRDSPALDVASRLHERGARVRVTDPIALSNAAADKPHLTMVEDLDSALRDADLVFLATEWPQFVGLDPKEIAPLVRARTVVDGRNVLDRDKWSEAGWTHVGIGR